MARRPQYKKSEDEKQYWDDWIKYIDYRVMFLAIDIGFTAFGIGLLCTLLVFAHVYSDTFGNIHTELFWLIIFIVIGLAWCIAGLIRASYKYVEARKDLIDYAKRLYEMSKQR